MVCIAPESADVLPGKLDLPQMPVACQGRAPPMPLRISAHGKAAVLGRTPSVRGKSWRIFFNTWTVKGQQTPAFAITARERPMAV
jgi:hypothetical protein